MENHTTKKSHICVRCGQKNSVVSRDKLNKTTQKFLGLDQMDGGGKAQVCRSCGHVIVSGQSPAGSSQKSALNPSS